MSFLGTAEGKKAEIDFVVNSNMYKKFNTPIWSLFREHLNINSNLDEYHVVRVVSKVYSKLSGKKVFPKADAYLASGKVPMKYLIDSKYYLDEKNISKFKLKPLEYSGISIKRPDSMKYQILKMVPKSFYNLIGNYVLGAGASIYCKNIEDLKKNTFVINGWNTTWNEFISYFSFIKNVNLINSSTLPEQEKTIILGKIKTYSNLQIKKIIQSDMEKLDIVFKGTHIFNEPYPANFLFKNDICSLNYPYDFIVTTGSGRSKGDFTIVIKP